MKNLTESYTQALIKNNLIEGLGEAKIRYALAVLKNELLKFLLLGLIFLGIGYGKAFFFTMILILPIRMTTGGLHFDSNAKCFLCTLTYFVSCICLLPKIQLSMTTYTIILAVSALIIMLMPLAPCEKRPIISEKKYKSNKVISIVVTLIVVALLLCIINDSSFLHCGIWALLLQALQLVYCRLTGIMACRIRCSKKKFKGGF